MTTILMATLLEARPFVQGLSMESIAKKPLPVFVKDGTHLVIAGIGKANAAMATTYAIQNFNPTHIYNLGAAGAVRPGLTLGAIRQIDQIIEPDRPHLISGKPHVHYPDMVANIETASLATSDRPVLDIQERQRIAKLADLVDMEGAAVVQTCRKFDLKCHVFKFVSDTPEHSQDADIVAHIRSLRKPFFDYISSNIDLWK